MFEAVNASPHAGDLAAMQVFDEKLGRVAGATRLPGREVAFLPKRGPIETIPIRLFLATTAHAQILTLGLGSCNNTNINCRFGLLRQFNGGGHV